MILTNNMIIKDKYNNSWVEGDQKTVLYKARDLIHKGHRLITSPLAASGRMHYSPVRTIILSDEPGEVDLMSIEAIESGILKLETALGRHTVDHRNLK
ncbi:MAG: GrdX family protein, partial [Clostridiaceae bacterium]